MKLPAVALTAATALALLPPATALAQQPAAAQQTATAQQPAVSTMTTPAVDGELTAPPAQLTPNQIKGMQHKLADWPDLARYRADNAHLPPPQPGQARVVFFGDSITDGWGRGHGHFFPDQPWLNRGISGQTTPQMLVRFRQDVINLHPEAVVILAGINDIAGNTGPETLDGIEDNFRAFVALAEAAHVRVVLSSVLPAGHFPWRPGVDPRDEVAALNTFLQTLATQHHAVYLNYFPALVTSDRAFQPALTVDGIHPNDAGYAVMEPLARAAVKQSLAQPRP